MADNTTRLEPHNAEAERAVLGSLLIDRDTIIQVAPILQPGDFYLTRHEHLYRAILDLYHQRTPADLITLETELHRRELIDTVGGMTAVVEMMTATPTAVHCEHYAGIVRDCAIRRRFIRAASEIAAAAWDESVSTNDVMNRCTEAIHQAASTAAVDSYTTMEEVMELAFDQIGRGEEYRLNYGLKELDRLSGGMYPGQLVIIAARTSMGKTAMALNFAYNNAAAGKRVGILSLEMSRHELAERLLAMDSRVNSRYIRLGKLEDDEWTLVTQSIDKLGRFPMYIHDRSGSQINEVMNHARAIHARAGIDLLVVDYLQLMEANTRSQNRAQEVGIISRRLKLLAGELNIPVIAISQLNRAPEGRADHRPMLSDLRESGAIENDADVVLLIHRPEYYGEVPAEEQGIAEVTVAKNRNGIAGKGVKLRWIPEIGRFVDMSLRAVA